MSESRARAAVPVALGLSGLVPFVAAAAGAVVLEGPAAAAATTASAVYGAVILSFLGGVHWGTGLSSGRAASFLWAVTPSLAAFFAAFLPLPWMLGVLSAGFVLAGAVDVAAFSRTGPRWYVRLRVALTLVVVVALGVTSATAPDRPLVDVSAILSPAA